MFDEVAERVHAVLGAAAGLVGDTPLAVWSGYEDADRLRSALDRSEQAVEAWSAAHPAEHAAARAVLNELGSVRLQLQTFELSRRRDSVANLQAALHRLRAAASTDELAAQVPHEVATLGFRRALFSWVDQARWVPVSFHSDSGPEEARAVMEAGSPPYWHTRDLLEAELIRHRRPMLVQDALGNPHVHLDIQAVMQSRSYVAAPLLRRAGVAGFVHADQSVEAGFVDEFDRDLVNMFTEGLGLAFERLAVLDELATVRSLLGNQASALYDLVAHLDAAEAVDPRRHDPDRDVVPVRSGVWDEELTRREEQVLRLLADGRTNAEIAERLYITESTAKTHVKHVLRKVGASNRAQAAALYHRERSEG